MYQIFNFFGSILGYLLWFFYVMVKNYGVAIILFTVVLKIFMFPFSIKQQKSMAAQSKIAAKQKELQEKYGNDKVKLNEEIQKLYDKEGVNPVGGCLPTMVPFIIMFGLYYSVIYPLQNALHLPQQAVQQAVQMFQHIPGVSGNFASTSQYGEMAIVKHFTDLRPYLTMFSTSELDRIESFSHGFKFLGLDLLSTPKGSPFISMLWLIPIFCLIFSLLSQFIMMRMQPAMQQQQGCMKWMMYLLPLISVYFAYILPAAIGFYYTISTLTSFASTVVMNKFYSTEQLTAKAEAQRTALRYQEELEVKPLPASVQQKLADKILASQAAANTQNTAKKSTGKKKNSKKRGANSGSNDEYMGTKK